MVLNNNKGQLMVVKIMIAILILIATVILSPALIETVNTGTTTADLNCTSTTLDVTQTATCVVVDNYIFMLLGTFICVGMSFIAGNKNGFGVINAIIIFIITMVLISPLKYWIGLWRDASHLSCATTTSVATKMMCILADAWLFWFVVVVLGASLTYLFNKKVDINAIQ